MAVGQSPLGQFSAQSDAKRLGVAGADQALLQLVEQGVFLIGLQGGMIGDIVARAHEIIKSEDDRTQGRGDQRRGDGKIFVTGAFAGPQAFRRDRRGAFFADISALIISPPDASPPDALGRGLSTCRPARARIARLNRAYRPYKARR